MSDSLIDRARSLAEEASALAREAAELAAEGAASAGAAVPQAVESDGGGGFVFLLTVFVLACFVGYHVVWRVTPALHSPLMGVTNAVSSVIIVGALIAAGPMDWSLSKIFGLIAVILASVNIFGGFIVTQRMLSMFKKKG
ncbi:MAG: NAD(P) transhydrogenase subunit alpha [Alphaproteobacteria bacterium]|nr:NAD(P) transhydrogenase subunit alpha [Alphaproteobacteria bacterium]